MKKIDLNCDLGESFGAYTLGHDTAVMSHISSANIACGFHAGDAQVMEKTVALCKEAGVSIGAHPGFPDLQGFGRRNMAVLPQEVKAYVTYQIGALAAFCKAARVRLCHVKPHGALYNMAAKDSALAAAVAEAIYAVDPTLTLLALSGSQMLLAARAVGLPCAAEVFADRGYEADGTLVARTKPGAMVTDAAEAVRRVVRMCREGKVRSVTGEDVEIEPQSVCVHGDGAEALDFVRSLRAALTAADILVQPFRQ
jgi:UPF0271 protein